MSLAVSCAILALVLVPAAILVAWVCVGRFSVESLIAAAVASVVCWSAASLALCATYFGNRWQSPVQGVLAGMLFRLGLPLVAIVVLPKLNEAWSSRSIATTILGVYLVALVVETALALRMVPLSPRVAKAA